jgi:hypothetical protein
MKQAQKDSQTQKVACIRNRLSATGIAELHHQTSADTAHSQATEHEVEQQTCHIKAETSSRL